jgi:hypothetical protein
MEHKLQKSLDWLKSDAGKAAFEVWAEKHKKAKQRHSDWVERLTPAIQANSDAFIEKLCTKYYSDEYRDKWYGKGIEPPETLLWYLYSYAEKNCIKCTDQQHLNMFTRDAYYIGSYVIQVMDGQGSVVKVDRREVVLYEEDLKGLTDDEAGELIRNSDSMVYKREITQEEFNEFKKQLS